MAKGFGQPQTQKRKSKKSPCSTMSLVKKLEEQRPVASPSEVEEWVKSFAEAGCMSDIRDGDLSCVVSENQMIVSVCDDMHTLLMDILIETAISAQSLRKLSVFIYAHPRSQIVVGGDNLNVCGEDLWMSASRDAGVIFEGPLLQSLRSGLPMSSRDLYWHEDDPSRAYAAEVRRMFFSLFQLPSPKNDRIPNPSIVTPQKL